MKNWHNPINEVINVILSFYELMQKLATGHARSLFTPTIRVIIFFKRWAIFLIFAFLLVNTLLDAN